MKLAVRELPMVHFRRALPDYLAGGVEAFIEVDARCGGAVNPAYVAAVEAIAVKGRIMDVNLAKIDRADERVKADKANALKIMQDRIAALYDACVIEWRSNILDDGKPIECNRETFLALAEVREPHIAAAVRDLEEQVLETGKALFADTQAVLKN